MSSSGVHLAGSLAKECGRRFIYFCVKSVVDVRPRIFQISNITANFSDEALAQMEMRNLRHVVAVGYYALANTIGFIGLQEITGTAVWGSVRQLMYHPERSIIAPAVGTLVLGALCLYRYLDLAASLLATIQANRKSVAIYPAA